LAALAAGEVLLGYPDDAGAHTPQAFVISAERHFHGLSQAA